MTEMWSVHPDYVTALLDRIEELKTKVEFTDIVSISETDDGNHLVNFVHNDAYVGEIQKTTFGGWHFVRWSNFSSPMRDSLTAAKHDALAWATDYLHKYGKG